jgi:hypothetical protein
MLNTEYVDDDVLYRGGEIENTSEIPAGVDEGVDIL